MPRDIVQSIKVKEVFDLIECHALTITLEESILDLLNKITSDKWTRHVYVVDKDSHLVGAVRFNDIISYICPDTNIPSDNDLNFGDTSFINYFKFSDAHYVKDIMNEAPVSVKMETSLKDVLGIMQEEKINELPIVDSDNHVIGEVNLMEVISKFIEFKTASES